MSRILRSSVVVLFLATLSGSLSAAEWGDLRGRFVYDGMAPTQEKLNVNKDIEVCTKVPPLDESLVVGKDGGIANIVIYLYQSFDAAPPPVHESYAATAEDKVTIDNQNCRFDPHVVLLRTTQTLVLGNKDPVGHNTKVDTFTNLPINPIIPATSTLDQKFAAPERLPSQVSCSIHPWMTGWIVIKDNPYFAVTNDKGEFEIKNVPAGDWEFQVWQEKSGYVSNVKKDGAAVEWAKGRVPVKMTSAGVDLGTISVSPDLFKK